MTKYTARTWLALDVNYLAWRAFHSTGKLKYGSMPTGVMYGVLRDIHSLQDQFNTNLIIFCFDCGTCLRCLAYPKYKSSRRDKGNEEVYEEVKQQINHLRKRALKQAGFKNIFYQKGYEADDMIASVCKSIPKYDTVVIVSADKDLYQLLSDNVKIYNPHQKKITTYHSFVKKWGIEPEAWIDVESICGGHNDLEGVKGVGAITAAKFLRGVLKDGNRCFQDIVSGTAIWNRNRSLVKLPYPGVKEFIPYHDHVTAEKWKRLAESLGMQSLVDVLPSELRRKRSTKKHKGFL